MEEHSEKETELEKVKYTLHLLSMSHSWHLAHQKAIMKAFDILNTIVFKETCPLVVFDLNGVLLERQYLAVESDRFTLCPTPAGFAGQSSIWLRPGVVELMEKLMETHHVAIWANEKLVVVQKLLKIFPECIRECLFVWGQENCDEVVDSLNRKIYFRKNPQRIWEAYPQYEGNTIMVEAYPETISSSCLRRVKPWTRNDPSNALELFNVITE